MTKSIRAILSPLLIISYVSGLRIIEFPVGHPWFGLLYILLFWSVYCISLKPIIISHFVNKRTSIEYDICLGIDFFIIVLSVVFGAHHDKKFRHCLRKLDIVDDTLLKLGTTTNYRKLHTRIIWLVLVWFAILISANYGSTVGMITEYNFDIITAIYEIFMRNYCSHINAISDLTIATILGYLRLKFDQVNELVWKLTNENEREIKRKWKNPALHSHRRRFSKARSNQYIIWIVIHLHLELCKISREIDSIFGTQMTFKMGCYFAWLALNLREIFSLVLINSYIKRNKILYGFIILSWLLHNILKLFLINYLCETVSTKANLTGHILNKIPYSTYDVEVRENISQFILQMTHKPLKFCGIGLFQFGYKFLHRFCTSVVTVLVLLMQVHMHEIFLKNNY